MVRTCRKTGVQVDLFDGEPPAPRPAWRVIEAARTRRLTGELSLPTNPPTNVYLLNGEVYFAERTTDGGIGVRLLVEGVITRKQMSKGAVMVSGAEHLGRLFERDDTIDRHAVELCVELMTDDVLTSVSKETVDSYTMTLYKRHPSGIDRWLSNEPVPDTSPVSEEQRESVLADLQAPVATTPINGSAAHHVPPPIAAVAPQQAIPKLAVPEPTAAQPVAPTPPLPVAASAPPHVAEAASAVARTPEPPLRTPERIELDEWPKMPTWASADTPAPAATRSAEAYPKLAESSPAPVATTGETLPGAIADEVADAVRRALAAIDSVLTPADDQATK